MHKLLLAVDGSAAAHRAVQYAVALAAVVPSIEVVLLNVQPEIDDWSVLRVLTREEVEAMEESRAGDVLREGCAVLQAAGVRFTPVVEIGTPAACIARVAAEHNCDGIVMGSRGMGAVSAALLGSVSSEVLQSSDLPLTLIR